MNDGVQREVERRKARGYMPSIVAGINAALANIGYKLDRSLDCHGVTRIISGDGAGETYQAITTGIKEIDTGMAAFHYAARRDGNFKELQRLRFEEGLYAIVRGRILSI